MKKWFIDPTEGETIRTLIAQGYTHASIATLLNCRVTRVRYVAYDRRWRDQPINDATQLALPPVAPMILRKRTKKKKLTPALVQRIRALAKCGKSQREIAKDIGVTQTNICYTLRGSIHSDVPQPPQLKSRINALMYALGGEPDMIGQEIGDEPPQHNEEPRRLDIVTM